MNVGNEQDYFPLNHAVVITAIITTAYFTVLELIQISIQRLEYFTFFNMIDVSSFVLNIHLLIVQVTDSEQVESKLTRKLFAVFLMWFNLIYWLRVFEKTTLYIRLIKDTIIDMGWFLLLYILIVVMFASMILMINASKMKNSLTTMYEDEISEYSIINALIHQYLASLGDFSLDDYSKSADPDGGIDWTVFLCGTFFVNIVLVNMLIALMGDTYDNVFENKRKAVLLLKIQALSEFSFLFKKLEEAKYLFVITLKKSDELFGTDIAWEGKIKAIQRSIQRSIIEKLEEFGLKSK